MIRERILRLYADGLPVPEIARRVGRSTATVYVVTRGAGPTRPQQLHNRVLAALQASEAGLSSTDIAAAIGEPGLPRGRVANSIVALRGRGHVIETKAGGRGGYKLVKTEASQ